MKTFLRGLIVLLIIGFVGGAIYMSLYQYIDDYQLNKVNNELSQVATGVATSFLQEIAPKVSTDIYAADFVIPTSVEYIPPEVLAKTSNSGRVRESLEDRETGIYINSALVDTGIVDGQDAFAMERGPWHFPLSSYPGEKGNFVVIGHRFAEIPPSTNTFFNLDKVNIGDKIEIVQEGGIEYTYTVVESKVVDKTDRTVLGDFGDHRITLITCEPLWTSDERLIVVGLLDKAYQNI